MSLSAIVDVVVAEDMTAVWPSNCDWMLGFVRTKFWKIDLNPADHAQSAVLIFFFYSVQMIHTKHMSGV